MNAYKKIQERDHTPSGIGNTFAVRGWDDGSGDRNLGAVLGSSNWKIDAAQLTEESSTNSHQ